MRTLAIFIAVVSVAVLTCAGALKFFHWKDGKRFDTIRSALEKHGDGAFDAANIATLPAAARRYFEHAIAPGTPLYASADLRLGGTLRTAAESDPDPVTAELRLAPPFGFAWSARLANAKIDGTETYFQKVGAIRFVSGGFLPASQENADVARAGRARLTLEATLLPTTLLPIRGAEWEPIDDDRARVTLRIDDEPIVMTITVDAAGRLTRAEVSRPVVLDRAQGFVDRPFVMTPSEETTVHGLTVPAAYRLVVVASETNEIEFAAPRVLELIPR
jgi:hypothetical protein